MKKAVCLPALVIAAAVLCSCGAATASAPSVSPSLSLPPSSQEPPPPSSSLWDKLYDMAGNKFDFAQEDTQVSFFEVNYALGWTLDDPQYKTIRSGDTIAGYEVSFARSSYSIQQPEGKPISAMADTNEYGVNSKEPLQGVLVFGAEELAFYPYFNEDGKGFLLLSEISEDSKTIFTQESSLALESGQPIHVQPIRCFLSEAPELIQKLCAAVSGKADCDPAFRESLVKSAVLDVTLSPEMLYFRTLSQGRGGGMWGTVADVTISGPDGVAINGVLGTAKNALTRLS